MPGKDVGTAGRGVETGRTVPGGTVEIVIAHAADKGYVVAGGAQTGIVGLIEAVTARKAHDVTAVGIEQKKVYKAYDKVLYVREPLEVGASLGFLPGTVDEKYGAYMGGLYDNIRVIASYSGYNENNLRESVECVPPQYMRGRSLESTYVIVDEAQNLNLLSIRTLLTRMGRGGKIVLLGSENQVDIKKWKGGETDFGKSYGILSKFGFVARVDLVKSERSDYCALIDGAFGDYLSGR